MGSGICCEPCCYLQNNDTNGPRVGSGHLQQTLNLPRKLSGFNSQAVHQIDFDKQWFNSYFLQKETAMITIERNAQATLYAHLYNLVKDNTLSIQEANAIFLRFYGVAFEDYRTV